MRSRLTVVLAVLAGLAIGWVDSRPGWDATGITVFAALAASFGAAWLAPRLAPVLALAVGLPTPLFELDNHAAFAALAFAAVGAAVGALSRREVVHGH